MTRQTNSCLPRGWVCAVLGDLVEPSDKKVDPADAQNMLYIGLEHIAKDNGKLLGHGHANDVKSTKTVFHAGDLLYGRLRPYLNKVHVVDCDGICSTDILVFPANPYRSNKFLLYRILCSDFVSFVSRNMSGVQHPRVSSNTISLFPVSLPPLPEQHRIVAKIEELFTRLDAGVESLTKIKSQLKRYRQAVLKHAFEGKLTAEWRKAHQHELEPASVLLERIKQERRRTAVGEYKELSPRDTSSLPELPKGWVWTGLSEVATVVTGNTPSKKDPSNYGDYIPFVKPPELRDCVIAAAEDNLSSKGAKIARILPAESILVSCIGNLGKTGINKVPVAFNQQINAVIFPVGIVPKYGFYYCQALREWLNSIASATTVTIVNKSRFESARVRLPPLLEQQRIVEEIERRLSVADQIEKTVDQSLKQAERLRQSILKRAFEGKLVPHDPNDEPAEKLLERIGEERARAQVGAKSKKVDRKRITSREMRLM